MRTLAQAMWLNDEVISMWLGLLSVRTLEAGNVKRVHFFETHFFAASFATLRASCAVPAYAEPRLSQWSGRHGTGTS